LAKESKSKSKKLYIGKYSVGKILVGLLLVGVFAFFSISVVNQNADISRLEKQKAEIGAKYDAQQEENKELQAVLDEDKDDYIEKKAREKGYVKSDEIVFYDISSGK
jgi:cell division protein FtsB